MDEDRRGTAGGGSPIHSESRIVRFQDVDAAGVVFYARVFDYFHDAYVSCLRSRGASLEAALSSGAWAAPLRRAEADYRRPLRFGDAIRVSVASARVEETEFTLEYRIDRDGETVCVGRTIHVSVDPETFVRAPVPDVVKEALG
jgi:1,4-dihydroxy-2-naphthoyl-CoA hydrolase